MTIKEIAILAKTSRGTVDRVINKRGNVSKAVERRVLKVIKETNYQPNEIARSLSLSTKKINIGVIIGTVGNPFFGLVLEGIKSAAKKYYNAGLQVNIKKVNIFDKTDILKAISKLKTEKIDGLIVTATNDDDIINAINSLKVPTVTLSTDLPINRISHVACNYNNSGKLASNFLNLLKPNGAKVGIIIGSKEHPGQSQRIVGFKEVKNENIEIVCLKETMDDESRSFKTVKEIAKNHPDIDVLLFFGAGIVGGLTALKELDNNMKAITVDVNDEVLDGLNTGLVLGTINQYPYDQGFKTLELVYEYLIGKKEIEPRIEFNNIIILKESIIPHKIND